MNWSLIISSLLSVVLAEEAKVLTAPLTYGGYPYAGAATAKVEVKTIEAPVLPAVTYAAAPGLAYSAAAPPLTYAAAAPVVAAAAPVVAAAAPVVAAAPAVSYAATAPVIAAPYSAGSQFHAQDDFGNLNYGYANINSVKQEVGNTYGGVSGGYSYVDANGELQQVQYIADGAGFRVADSRLPVAPVYDGIAPTFNLEPLVALTFNPELPVAPVDTPKVAEAKAAHLAAVEEAKAAAADPAERKRREANHGYAGIPYATGLPYSAGYGYAGLGYGLSYYG